MHHSSKSRFFVCLTFFYLVTSDDLETYIMVTKHKKWYLQMSETLSMLIRWLCLSLTSKFCSPMSPSPKNRAFWLWPELWRHWWSRVHLKNHRQFFQGFQMPLVFLESVQQFRRWEGGISSPPRFLAISSKPMQLSPPNLQYPLSQQFYTLR